MYIHIVHCKVHCPVMPVAREEEEKEVRKEENYISMKVYRIKNGRADIAINPLV